MTCCNPKKDEYRPDYSQKPITLKPYARHDVITADGIERIAKHYENEIEKRLYFDLRRHRYAPLTENQVYGWMEHCAIGFKNSSDAEVMHHPRRIDVELKMIAEVHRILGHRH